jgi:hypothetical protein
VTLPARTSKLSASTATVGPYRFVRSLASIIELLPPFVPTEDHARHAAARAGSG